MRLNQQALVEAGLQATAPQGLQRRKRDTKTAQLTS